MAVTVNGVEVKESDIQAEIKRLRPEYEAYVSANGGAPDEAQLREWAEEDLIEEALFRAAAVASQPVPSDDRVRQELEAHAETYKDVPEEERFVRGREALQQRRLIKEIRKRIAHPGEAAVRAYFDQHPEQFVAPEALRLSHLCRYVDPGTRSDVLLDLLRIKTDLSQSKVAWVEAVEACSDTFRQDSGMFATVARNELPAEIEKQLFALRPGEISDVIDFGQGTLHLFRLLAHLEPEKVAFETVKEHLAGVLFEQACQDALHAKFDELKAAAVIRREP